MLKASIYLLVACGSLCAQVSKTTPAQVENLVKKAVVFAQKAGTEKLVSEINGGIFHVSSGGELYLSTYSTNGTILAVGFNGKALAGKDGMVLKDVDGKLFLKEALEKVKANGSAWVEYKWKNPSTDQIGTKRAYFEAVPGQNIVVAAGYYK